MVSFTGHEQITIIPFHNIVTYHTLFFENKVEIKSPSLIAILEIVTWKSEK